MDFAKSALLKSYCVIYVYLFNQLGCILSSVLILPPRELRSASAELVLIGRGSVNSILWPRAKAFTAVPHGDTTARYATAKLRAPVPVGGTKCSRGQHRSHPQEEQTRSTDLQYIIVLCCLSSAGLHFCALC